MQAHTLFCLAHGSAELRVARNCCLVLLYATIDFSHPEAFAVDTNEEASFFIYLSSIPLFEQLKWWASCLDPVWT